MGREIRRVPPWWVHPQKEVLGVRGFETRYTPMYDKDFATAYAEWVGELQAWLVDAQDDGTVPARIASGGRRTEAVADMRQRLTEPIERASDRAEYVEILRLIDAGQLVNAFVMWNGSGPPDPDSCRPWWAASDATAYQVYETVSEGTPSSPVLATRAELVAWLCADHDDWPGIIGWENPGTGRDDFTRHGTWRAFTPEMAERFIGDESIPTFVTIGKGDGPAQVMTSLDERARR